MRAAETGTVTCWTVCLFGYEIYSFICVSLSTQGNDEEAVVDHGKTSSTINTNFEKEELESK